jgi:hypothetical protein
MLQRTPYIIGGFHMALLVPELLQRYYPFPKRIHFFRDGGPTCRGRARGTGGLCDSPLEGGVSCELVSGNPDFDVRKKREQASKSQVRSVSCCGLTIINFYVEHAHGREQLDAGKVFRGFQEIRAAIWRPSCRAYPAANQKLTNFCTLYAIRAMRARVRARPPKFRAFEP